jgi:hypothetical protein
MVSSTAAPQAQNPVEVAQRRALDQLGIAVRIPRLGLGQEAATARSWLA